MKHLSFSGNLKLLTAWFKVSSTGVTIKIPMPSPSHVVQQLREKLLHGAQPKMHVPKLPRIEPRKVDPMTAPATKARTSRNRSSLVENPLLVSKASPASACRVTLKADVAMTADGIPAVEFNSTEPRTIPGHIRRPCSSSAARAIPAGGHTGEASAFTSPSIDAASFPVTK